MHTANKHALVLSHEEVKLLRTHAVKAGHDIVDSSTFGMSDMHIKLIMPVVIIELACTPIAELCITSQPQCAPQGTR
jgi:hypothetical protein